MVHQWYSRLVQRRYSLVQQLLHGDDRYAVVSSRQRNTMTRAAWDTARFPSFSVSRLPRFQAGTVTRAAAPSLLLSLVLEVYLYFVVVSFLCLPALPLACAL